MECEVLSFHAEPTRFANHASSQQLYKSIDITHPVTGEHNGMLILAHVKYIHVLKDVLKDKGVTDFTMLLPVWKTSHIPPSPITKSAGRDFGSPAVHPTHAAEHSSSKHSNEHTRIVVDGSNIRKISDVLLEGIGFAERSIESHRTS
ncbi:hypothetical protein DFJ58DRAFT_841242 [Suillus subalutaceus]|uniref:uncharacterized protein n=1 Tax=Suillus subalutaceus TaxID=48586 RepID=UPI001B85C30B|nr:uncharacterized protein DFJ58DRAFT_841242 [Suillus subalutaceus]KAG1854947.1 hypothetical protein DFJ58DRAFT_841242 [Suillus subalutaceus]